ncbi:MAG: TrkH family potassium uptake protein [bacterium]|nr:TrkH family potassium uptake protein [bacterium]
MIGAILLSLPVAKAGEGHLNFLDALFTATSAVCVTGLIVVDTGSYFSKFGQAVILVMIQLGGLGIMTFSTFFFALLGRKISIKEQLLLSDVLGKMRRTSFAELAKKILIMTFIFELVGSVILYLKWIPKYGAGKAIFPSIFHSISAFCNAGFSLNATSLEEFKGDILIVTVISILIIVGGFGFVVVNELLHADEMIKDRRKYFIRLSLQSKLVLSMTGILIISSAVIFFLLEMNNVLYDLNIKEKILVTFFQVITPRTAGFNVIPVDKLNNSSLLLTKVLMFIGGSPGSTAGGIKTTTFYILILLVFSMWRDRPNVEIYSKTIPSYIVKRVVVIAFIAVVWVFTATLILLITESNMNSLILKQGYFAQVLFEEVSAFGTVGLSTGITSHLSFAGKIVIILSMFLGRIGPLTLALAMKRKDIPIDYSYPEEKVMVG